MRNASANKSHHFPRRYLLTIAIFLLAGAVVNVGVAWGFAVWSNPFHGRYAFDDGQIMSVAKYWSRGATVVHFLRWRPPKSAENLSDLIPNWGELEEPSSDLEESIGWAALEERCVYGAGWPARALWCEPKGVIYYEAFMRYSHRQKLLPTHGYIKTSLTPWQGLGSGNKIPPPLPLRPTWPGFALNTILYAALLWLPFAPFALRRLIRRRRGLCPKCAYPMGESAVCTECGEELPGRVRAA